MDTEGLCFYELIHFCRCFSQEQELNFRFILSKNYVNSIKIESNDMGNSATAEPIEISVISMDTVQDMIIVQPDEMNQADTNSTVNIPLNNAAVELSNEANVTPSRKKRKITR